MKVFGRLTEGLPLSDEGIIPVESVRALARDRLATRAAHYDATAAFPWDNAKAINALGLNARFVPEAYGGAQVSRRRPPSAGKGTGKRDGREKGTE